MLAAVAGIPASYCLRVTVGAAPMLLNGVEGGRKILTLGDRQQAGPWMPRRTKGGRQCSFFHPGSVLLCQLVWLSLLRLLFPLLLLLLLLHHLLLVLLCLRLLEPLPCCFPGVTGGYALA